MQPPEQRETVGLEQRMLNEQTADLLCLHDSPFVRAMYLGAGFLALFLGILGAVLPILPTTPFVLLAAAWGTFLTTFAVTLNNHTTAAISVM